MKIVIEDISSIGWLHNHDKTICLTICLRHQNHPIFVTISKKEFDDLGGGEGLNNNKQIVIDFYNKYGAGRPGSTNH